MGLGSLGLLIDDPGPCPVCDETDCTHIFYGDEHWRIGDGGEKHQLISRRHIPAPHRIYSQAGRLLFAQGDLMAAEEAIEHGVPIPGQTGPGRKKGRRQRPSTAASPQGPEENRAHQPDQSRSNSDPDPRVLPADHG